MNHKASKTRLGSIHLCVAGEWKGKQGGIADGVAATTVGDVVDVAGSPHQSRRQGFVLPAPMRAPVHLGGDNAPVSTAKQIPDRIGVTDSPLCIFEATPTVRQ